MKVDSKIRFNLKVTELEFATIVHGLRLLYKKEQEDRLAQEEVSYNAGTCNLGTYLPPSDLEKAATDMIDTISEVNGYEEIMNRYR